MHQLLLRVTASDVAKFTGHNFFSDEDEIRSCFWRSNLPLARSLGVEATRPPASNVESVLSSLPACEVDAVSSRLGVDASRAGSALAKRLLSSSSVCSAATSAAATSAVAEEVDRALSVVAPTGAPPLVAPSSETVRRIEEAAQRDAHMRRGSVLEKRSLDAKEAETGRRVQQRNGRTYEREVLSLRDGSLRVHLRGRVDGLLDGRVVEAKQRRARLFGCVPAYERVQLHCYMFLTSTTSSTLRETFDDQCAEHEVRFDDEFWEECVEKLGRYVEREVPSGGEDPLRPSAP